MPVERLRYLLHRYHENKLTETETEELMLELVKDENEEEIKKIMDSVWKNRQEQKPVFSAEKSESILAGILKTQSLATNKRPARQMRWVYAVAASVILLLGAAFIYQLTLKKTEFKEVAKQPVDKQDVAPGGNKALLTLSDGSTIVLDSAANGNLASQGNVKVIKLDGQLAYNSTGNNAEILYNTISTPRGGQYQLVLADGSKVWLNAASSLRFPAAFTGRERKVELTGEAYFEVAKNTAQPFKVQMNNGMEVEVVGTHFNIMGYDNEAAIKTTLAEGKVKVSQGSNMVMLIPNQQAQLAKTSDKILVDKNADTGKATAWKDGLFDFEDDDITDIMRQLSRWYDVEIEYAAPVTEQHFTGSIRRQVNISQVLLMLQNAGGVQFEIEGKKIVVRTK